LVIRGEETYYFGIFLEGRSETSEVPAWTNVHGRYSNPVPQLYKVDAASSM